MVFRGRLIVRVLDELEGEYFMNKRILKLIIIIILVVVALLFYLKDKEGVSVGFKSDISMYLERGTYLAKELNFEGEIAFLAKNSSGVVEIIQAETQSEYLLDDSLYEKISKEGNNLFDAIGFQEGVRYDFKGEEEIIISSENEEFEVLFIKR